MTPEDGQIRVSNAESDEGSQRRARTNTTLYTPVQGGGRAAGPLLAGKSIVQIASELGISDSSLHSWLKQTQIDAGQREGLTTQEREELRRLRKENEVLRQEREILKKVAHGPWRATPKP